jgi:hypothetical protein
MYAAIEPKVLPQNLISSTSSGVDGTIRFYNSIPVSSRKRCCNGGGELPVQNPVQFEEDTPGNWHNLRPDTCPINGIHFSLALNELRQL